MNKKPTKSSPSASSHANSKPRRQGLFSCDQIGEIAGDIWKLLSEKDGQNMTAIKSSIDAPADVVAAAVGWLAREDKIEFNTSGRTVNVRLRK